MELEHSIILAQISGDIKEIKTVLIGSELNGNIGIVHDVIDLKKRVYSIEEWKIENQSIEKTGNNTIKKHQALISVAAALVAALSALFQFLSKH